MISKMAKRRGEKGFTLIELMIVVAIIGILAAIAIPNFISFKKKALLGTAVANIETARGSLAQFSADDDMACYPTNGALGSYADLRAIVGNYGLSLPDGSPGAVKWANNVQYTQDAADCTQYTLAIQASDGETFFKATTVGVCCSEALSGASSENCDKYARNVQKCSVLGIE